MSNSSEKTTSTTESVDTMLWGMKPNTYCMLLHLSQLLVFILPVLGVVAPIILWVINKDKEPLVDKHGKIVINWLLSEFIYAVVSVVLLFVGIGFVTLAVLSIIGIVFPIIGSVKANDGIVWNYPLSIRFFK
ncbi:MAG: DUF4870 domain-containing protein [Planctomycetaceae bacterium]|jgi:uncharacterized Tic20 family protein|nr:DUF4870 domain-containing protein [Planctomycetaceae bacterium]